MSVESLNRGVAFADSLVEKLGDELLGEIGPGERLLFVSGFLSRVTAFCGGAVGVEAIRVVMEKTKEAIDELASDGRIE